MMFFIIIITLLLLALEGNHLPHTTTQSSPAGVTQEAANQNQIIEQGRPGC